MKKKNQFLEQKHVRIVKGQRNVFSPSSRHKYGMHKIISVHSSVHQRQTHGALVTSRPHKPLPFTAESKAPDGTTFKIEYGGRKEILGTDSQRFNFLGSSEPWFWSTGPKQWSTE